MNISDSSWKLLSGPSDQVARRLLGCVLERKLEGHIVRLRIVETEAYSQTDAASHSYHGRTPRNDVMFGPAGHLYVYFTYGMHYCMNVVTGPTGDAAAVLIRAAEPLDSMDILRRNRNYRPDNELLNGPAKLCHALAIDKTLNGHNLQNGPLRLMLQPPLSAKTIVQTTRIGISKAQDEPWRFYERGNKHVSRS